jgi:GTP-binding protein
MLAFLIESTSDDPKGDYKKLLNELESYDKLLIKRKRIIVFTKIDLINSIDKKVLLKLTFGRNIPVYFISAVSDEGIKELIAGMWKVLQNKL